MTWISNNELHVTTPPGSGVYHKICFGGILGQCYDGIYDPSLNIPNRPVNYREPGSPP